MKASTLYKLLEQWADYGTLSLDQKQKLALQIIDLAESIFLK
jgi:hypothetical protein